MKPTRPDKKIIKKKSMLLRDYFAGQALIGLMGKTNECNGVVGSNRYEYHLAIKSYQIADAMIEERDNDKTK